MTVTVIGAVGGTPAGAFQGPFSGSVNANSDGTFSIDPRDQAFALAAGYIPARRETVQYVPKTAPTILTVRQIVSSVALGNTSLTIANQPDVVRQCQIRVDPGTSAITAGICRVTCGAQVDALSLVTAASTLLNVPFTKGAMTVASAVVTGLTGGTSPKIQIDTTASLAVPIPPNCADVTIIKEITNSADSSANLGTLTTAGNLDTAHRAEFDAYLRRRLRHGFTEPGATLSTALKAAYSRHVVGDLDGALPYYATGLRGAQRPEPWLSVASLLSDRGQHEAALVCARKALDADPAHPDANKNLGCILYRMQRYGEARIWLEAAIALRLSDHEIAFNLGAACFALGDLAESERRSIEAVCTAPDEVAHGCALTQLAYRCSPRATTGAAWRFTNTALPRSRAPRSGNSGSRNGRARSWRASRS